MQQSLTACKSSLFFDMPWQSLAPGLIVLFVSVCRLGDLHSSFCYLQWHTTFCIKQGVGICQSFLLLIWLLICEVCIRYVIHCVTFRWLMSLIQFRQPLWNAFLTSVSEKNQEKLLIRIWPKVVLLQWKTQLSCWNYQGIFLPKTMIQEVTTWQIHTF